MQFWNRQARMSLALILLAASCSGTPEESWEEARVRQTTGLPTVTRAEIFVVGEPDDNVPEPKFPIYPYNNFAPILDRCEVSGAKAEELAAIWRSVDFEGSGSLCHYPVYALRLYSDDELVLETSLCWQCGNCFLADGLSDHKWEGFGDIDLKLAQRLRALLTPPPKVGSAFAVMVGAELMYLDDMKGARAELDEAVRLVPTNSQAYIWRSRFFEKTGEMDLAIAEYTEALKHIYPHSRPQHLEARGKLSAKAGDHQRAVEDFTETMELIWERYPQAPLDDLYLLRAESYEKLGKTAEAQADRKRAEPRQPVDDEFDSTEDSEAPQETEPPAP